jgi:hypothetical protein
VKGFCWERDPGAPFGLLIRIATAYLHSEVDQLEELRRRARRPGDEENARVQGGAARACQ